MSAERRHPPEGFEHNDDDPLHYGVAGSWYELVGPLYYASDNIAGRTRMGFYSDIKYISSMNRVHGGMMASFMDYLLYGTVSSAWEGAPLATVSLNVQYVSACPPDVWVEGLGTLIRAGQTMAFVSGEARTGDQVIVHATGTFRKLG